MRVVVRWRDGRASVAEVAALRRLLPALRGRPAAEVLREARESDEWVLATCHPADARRLRDESERAGLVAAVEPAPVPPLRAVTDEEVVAELTAGGHAVSDFFVVAGALCFLSGGSLMARSIDDQALSAATGVYLRRVGAREYATYQDFVEGHRAGSAGQD